MAESSIEWTDATWNPVTGCTRVSAGCDHCYAVSMTNRLEAMGQTQKYGGLTVLNGKGDRHFNGKIKTHDDALAIPLNWRKPRKVFVNSMSDLFHKDVPFEFIDRVFAVMALTPQHTYQVLTKRPDRMAEYLASDELPGRLNYAMGRDCEKYPDTRPFIEKFARISNGIPRRERWPLPNVWLGTSVENQKAADERIPHLLKCPAAVRFLSCEPLLGPVSLESDLGGTLWMGGQRGCGGMHRGIGTPECPRTLHHHHDHRCASGIDWVIVGGESGTGARPMHPVWARSLRDQCQAAGVPFFFKQWGAWLGGEARGKKSFTYGGFVEIGDLDDDKPRFHEWPDGWWSIRANKKAAGRLLDEREWNEMPAAAGVER